MRSVLWLTAVVTIAATGSGRAGAAPSVWLVPSVPLDDQVSGDMAGRLDEQLLLALSARHELELAQLKQRTASGETQSVAEARAAVVTGREQYQKFNFGEAQSAFQRAIALVESAGVPPGEATTLTTAMTELAVVQEAMGQRNAARDTCDALLTLRPDIRFDPIRVPPTLIKTCEAVRLKRSLQTRRVTLSSTPPFQQLYVDGQPMGSAPVSLELPTGTHYFLYVGADRLTLVDKIKVDQGSEPLAHSVQLPERPEAKLTDALRGQLRRRGILPQATEAACALGLVVSTDGVIVTGIERAAVDRLRLFAARVQTNKSQRPRVVVAELRDDLNDAREVLGRVAASLAAAAPGPSFVPPLAEEAQKLDYDAALFGLNREAQKLLGSREQEEPPKKRRSKTWLWITGAAVLVVGGAVTAGLVLGLNNGKMQVDAHFPSPPSM